MRRNGGRAVACLLLVLLAGFIARPVNAFAPYVVLYGDTLGGLGGACHTRCDVYTPDPYKLVEVWVWFLPDAAKGMAAAEFKLSYPTTTYLFQGPVTSNPMNQVELGTLNTGMSVAIGEYGCQHSWYWTHWQQLVVRSSAPSMVQVVPHPASGHIWVASCEPGYPFYDATTLGHFHINQSCTCALEGSRLCNRMQGLSEVGDVIVKGASSLDVYLDDVHDCTVAPFEDNFFLRSVSVPPDTVEILQAVRTDIAVYSLTLETAMVKGRTYLLEARNICSCVSCSPMCGNSGMQFVFDGIGTMLQSSSASLVGSGIEIVWELSEVDPGVEFFVSRSENGGDFTALDAEALERDGLRFTYVDRSVLPGRKYSYRVEYGVGAPSKLLFISETVRTPAMPLTLHQNEPNPFNPSTTISFYLPEASDVRLEIYDITGRLVDRLIAGERLGAGTHVVEWNGRDARDETVSSGVYFYRLTAGKETISKKMVLLR